MHDAETRALKRAVALLLLISLVRWAWTARAPGDMGGAAGDSVLPELLSASREVVDEEARRSEPLAEGERLDPNRADEVELDRLPGVGPSTARAIVSAREAGTVFRTPDDLTSVRGIGPATLERMRDFLDLDAPPRRASRPSPASRSPDLPVDLNRADPEELQTLPGIGPAIAERIVDARQEQLFTGVDDLVRVRGIGPATVERLRPRAVAAPRR